MPSISKIIKKNIFLKKVYFFQVKINPGIKKDVAKVVDTVDIEDITDKAAFCRCWRSKKVIT